MRVFYCRKFKPKIPKQRVMKTLPTFKKKSNFFIQGNIFIQNQIRKQHTVRYMEISNLLKLRQKTFSVNAENSTILKLIISETDLTKHVLLRNLGMIQKQAIVDYSVNTLRDPMIHRLVMKRNL